jgi:hypothetical protein
MGRKRTSMAQTGTAAYARKRRKIREIEMRVNRLRAFADGVLGVSDLRVGPISIAEILRDTAKYLEKSNPR